jgi:hypothetical protein
MLRISNALAILARDKAYEHSTNHVPPLWVRMALFR